MSKKYTTMYFGKGKNKIGLCLERKISNCGYAGLVFSNGLQERIVLAVNDRKLESLGIRNGYITVDYDGSSPLIVLSTETFNGIKRGNINDRFLLLHEIGHYVCGHLAQCRSMENEFSYRKAALQHNTVTTEELEADRFAAEYLGPEFAVLALQNHMEQRMAYDIYSGTNSDSSSGSAIMEYQLRIDALVEYYDLFECDDCYDEFEDE